MDNTSNWRDIFQQNFRTWHSLAEFLELTPEQQSFINKSPGFSLNVPRRLVSKMAKGTLDCPILKQFLPTVNELNQNSLFVIDPVGDQHARCGGKLLHKYQGRVLLVCTSVCAMHCRYCFRQNFDYDKEDKTFAEELRQIEEDDSIHEVILSGGDPLALSNRLLDSLLQRLAAIPHIKRIRFHTRFPVGIPERIDNEFIEMIKQHRCQFWIVLHINHPIEMDAAVLGSIKSLRQTGAVVCNQAVLLKGVNDSAEILRQLCETLVDNGVLPYYLHQLDRVAGAAHFEVSEEEGRELIRQLQEVLPGYAIPNYVKEIAGEKSKTKI